MDISPDNPLPLYYQVAKDLLDKIKSGELPSDAMLTPEVEMAQKFGVSRNTIRHAVGLLVKDGYLVRIPGRGTFVVNHGSYMVREEWVVTSTDHLIDTTRRTRVDFGPMELLDNPPDFVLEGLGLMKWNKVCLFKGCKYMNKRVASYLWVFVPYEIGVQIDKIDRGQRTILLCMEEHLGINLTQIDEYISVEKLTAEDCEVLKGRVGDPKIVIKRVYYSEGHPVEMTLNYYQASNFSFFHRITKRTQ